MNVYCDYNAGAPLRPEAARAMHDAAAAGGNPSSIHAAGRQAKARLEDARDAVAAALGARAQDVVFTSGATEALQLAMAASGAQSLIMSAIEHDGVFAEGERSGALVAPVGGDGVIDLDGLAALLAAAPKPALVALMLANNETGAVQPVARAAALAREAGALLLVDAAQAVGRMPVSLPDLDASYLVASSHKLGGPAGAGALALAPGAPFASPRRGGGQERGRRPGTENVAACAGFGVAAEIAARDWRRESTRLAALRDRFERHLPDGATIFATAAARLANVSLFALPGVGAETGLIGLDLMGVCASSGAACSSGKVRASRVLTAMGVDDELARCALRVSFGWASTERDADAAIAAVAKLAAHQAEAA